MHRITDKKGNKYIIDELGWEDGKVILSIASTWEYRVKTLKMHYRHERTWDDHMGNTPCGYYAIVPIGKERHRVYLDLYR